MIKSLRLRNFKNFADESLCLGPFTVIVGANASGKSNIRDAFRLLHGIGRGYTLPEVIGGKYGGGGQEVWEQIRGAAGEIVRIGESRFDLTAGLRLPGGFSASYRIRVGRVQGGRSQFLLKGETLKVRGQAVYTSHPPWPDPVRDQGDEASVLIRMAKTGSQKKYGHKVAVRPDQPALTQIPGFKHVSKLHKAWAGQVAYIFDHWRFLDPKPDLMREPAFPGQKVLGDSGENLPTVLQEVCADAGRRNVLLEWVRELTPMDVEDFEFPQDPITGLVRLAIRERSGRTISAYSASDGTLRFLAMLAALLDEDSTRLYVFEEIDNGLHPSRLRLLVDLIEQQTRLNATQVVTTSHSPELLSTVNDDTFQRMSVVCRLEDSADAMIRQVSGLPNASSLRKTQGLGRLLAGGWMETVLDFTEGEVASE